MTSFCDCVDILSVIEMIIVGQIDCFNLILSLLLMLCYANSVVHSIAEDSDSSH